MRRVQLLAVAGCQNVVDELVELGLAVFRHQVENLLALPPGPFARPFGVQGDGAVGLGRGLLALDGLDDGAPGEVHDGAAFVVASRMVETLDAAVLEEVGDFAAAGADGLLDASPVHHPSAVGIPLHGGLWCAGCNASGRCAPGGRCRLRLGGRCLLPGFLSGLRRSNLRPALPLGLEDALVRLIVEGRQVAGELQEGQLLKGLDVEAAFFDPLVPGHVRKRRLHLGASGLAALQVLRGQLLEILVPDAGVLHRRRRRNARSAADSRRRGRGCPRSLRNAQGGHHFGLLFRRAHPHLAGGGLGPLPGPGLACWDFLPLFCGPVPALFFVAVSTARVTAAAVAGSRRRIGRVGLSVLRGRRGLFRGPLRGTGRRRGRAVRPGLVECSARRTPFHRRLPARY